MPVPHEIVEAAYKGNLNKLQRKLAERGRARAPRGVLARLFPSGRRQLRNEGCLPDVLFWNVLSFWHSSRDRGAPPPLWCL